MIPELQQLFSDFKFFNNILINISGDITLENILAQLFKEKNLNDKNFYAFKLEKHFISRFYIFYFELKNKKANEYNPIRITIEKKSQNNTFRVVAIQYRNNEKTITLCDSFDSDLFAYTKANTKKEINFYNNLYNSLLMIHIEENSSELSVHHSFSETTQNTIKEKQNSIFGSYFENIKTVKEALVVINRVLSSKCESVEQQEIDLLSNEFVLEDCIYSGKLNKAQDVFKEEL